ncbi:hypothetical protein LPJ61_000232 [Coemansia biformis]|uniref:Rap-GAP domain-containing protein n=1 Tax=Coemansia biformis TaxID=1286918 RepID=A0A9W7YH44_9FUNG|nr:hypothetical protein LPJ61_000232 [Coemansia biformis]
MSAALCREIRSLDQIHARETIKMALFYVGPGQWSEAEILSNTRADTSLSYCNFVQSLGWAVDLATFSRYTGKLERDGSDGSTCPYFADEGVEVVFHESTSMPTSVGDPRQLNKTLAAVQVMDREFGAAIFDELTKRISVVAADDGSSIDSSLQAFLRQVMPSAVLYSQSGRAANTTKLALSEAVDEDEFEFALGEQRITRANGAAADSARHSLPADILISQEFIHSHRASVGCAGALLQYLETKCTSKSQGIAVVAWRLKSFMKVDPDTLSYLQIVDERRHPNMHSQSKYCEATSLFTLLDKTKSTAGREMLRRWVLCPLQMLPELLERQDAIAALSADSLSATLKDIRQVLSRARPVRAACLRIRSELHLADLESLVQFSYAIVKLHRLVASMGPMPKLIREVSIYAFLALDQSVFVELGCMIIDTVDFDASRTEERPVVAANVNSGVDHLRDTFEHLDDVLAIASATMEEATGVPVVAVYFPQLGFLSSIDTSRFLCPPGAEPCLDGWALKFQSDKQRYYKNSITDALDASPGDVFSQLHDAEAEVLLELQNKIRVRSLDVAHAAELAAQIDCLQSLAGVATLHGYCRPQIGDGGCYHIVQGRHPIVESLSAKDFIPNDVHLPGPQCAHEYSHAEQARRTLVIVGPNASGKSVLARQTALAVYMAHIGSYVPATHAVIGLTDRIAAMGRASESLSRRQSALSTDLRAVSTILEHAGPDSLVVLDEFGRGTSPIDGIGLLSGALELLALGPNGQPASLVVTHFHEIAGIQRIKAVWRKARIRSMRFKEGSAGPVYLFK